MSRRSKSKNTRDGFTIANPRLSFKNTLLRPARARPFQQIEDLRTFHPDGPLRSRRGFITAHHSLSVSRSRSSRVPAGLRFTNPYQVLTCVRRKIRKQVLFAKGGAGSRKMRRPKYNYMSSVRC